MAKKMLIESPPSSSEEEPSSSEEEPSTSEEELSSDEEIQLKKRKPESSSTTTKAKDESVEETDEEDSEDEESDENNETEEPKPKFERQNSANKKEQDDSSDSEEENKDGIKVEVPKPSEGNNPVGNDRGKQPNGLKSEVKLSPSASPLKVETEDGDTKKDFFARLWSVEDEIILLNSILEFRLKESKEVDSSSLESFCEFLRGKLSFIDKPEHRQVSGKIKALRNKYAGAAVARFSKEHDLKMKDIASQIWVSDVKSKPLERECSLLEEAVSRIVGSEKKFEFEVDAEEVQALEEKLREHKRLKLEHDVKRMDLMNETFKVIMEGIQKYHGL